MLSYTLKATEKEFEMVHNTLFYALSWIKNCGNEFDNTKNNNIVTETTKLFKMNLIIQNLDRFVKTKGLLTAINTFKVNSQTIFYYMLII